MKTLHIDIPTGYKSIEVIDYCPVNYEDQVVGLLVAQDVEKIKQGRLKGEVKFDTHEELEQFFITKMQTGVMVISVEGDPLEHTIVDNKALITKMKITNLRIISTD